MEPFGTRDPTSDRSCEPCGRIPRILVIDDDPRFLARVQTVLGRRNVELVCAETSRSALQAAQTSQIDLALIDYRLRGRESGLSLAHLLHGAYGIPFILISQYLNTALTVAAMKCGAKNVFDKPLLDDQLLGAVDELLPQEVIIHTRDQEAALLRAVTPSESPGAEDESVATTLAVLLLRGCAAKKDPKTNLRLARVAGVSTPVFRQRCNQCSVKPRDARDLARLLRALRLSFAEGATLASQFSCGDDRTAIRLLDRAGFPTGCRRVDLRTFFQTQRLIPGHLEVLSELAHLCANSPLFQDNRLDEGPEV